MIRLLMACIVAYSLMPEKMTMNGVANTNVNQGSEVTTQDTLSAVQSTFSDVLRFCDRNVETCLTAQALASEAKQKAIQTLNSFGKTDNNVTQNDNAVQIDDKTTAGTPQ